MIAADNSTDDLATARAGSFDVRFSLVEDPGAANISDNGGNVFNQDPQLAALANNGGPTETHLPAATSPAVDAGDPAFAPPPSTDQRDLPRVAGSGIDMGAVERALPVPGTIQLTFSAAAVAEGAGTVTITATRTGGSDGAVSVTVDTANGSAVAPGDYTAVAGALLNWADGDTANKSLNVTIVNDTLDEPDETFDVTLSNATGGATLGAPATVVVTIQDDDEPVSVVEVPTVGEWGLAILTALVAAAGAVRLRRRRGFAAPLVAITLVAGAAGAGAAGPVAATAPAAAAAPIRQAAATTVADVRATPSLQQAEIVTLRLADGQVIEVPAALLEIKDRRGRQRFGETLAVSDLVAGSPWSSRSAAAPAAS